MKLISHRGNIEGVVSNKENRPSYIDCAIQLGLEVEIDIRYIDNNFWLGHDTPDYIVDINWLNKRSKHLWLHCKNIDAVLMLKKVNYSGQYFCHTADPYVITSTGHLWVHDLTAPLNTNCIIPLLSKIDIVNFENKIVYAVCTDYINFSKYVLTNKGLL